MLGISSSASRCSCTASAQQCVLQSPVWRRFQGGTRPRRVLLGQKHARPPFSLLLLSTSSNSLSLRLETSILSFKIVYHRFCRLPLTKQEAQEANNRKSEHTPRQHANAKSSTNHQDGSHGERPEKRKPRPPAKSRNPTGTLILTGGPNKSGSPFLCDFFPGWTECGGQWLLGAGSKQMRQGLQGEISSWTVDQRDHPASQAWREEPV